MPCRAPSRVHIAAAHLARARARVAVDRREPFDTSLFAPRPKDLNETHKKRLDEDWQNLSRAAELGSVEIFVSHSWVRAQRTVCPAAAPAIPWCARLTVVRAKPPMSRCIPPSRVEGS